MKNDEDLMAAYVAGDGQALREIFDRYAPLLLGLLRRHGGSEADARDLLQQTFLQLHRARHDFRTGSRLRPWLVTIAINVRREHFRRRGRRAEEPIRSEPAASEGSPADGLIAAQEARRVRAALEQLSQQQREVIELHWFGGLPFDAIAQTVGASLSAVKVRAHRGYEQLRRTLVMTDGAGEDGNSGAGRTVVEVD